MINKGEEDERLYEEAMTKGFIKAALAILIFVGVTGSGKSLFKRLVLGLPSLDFSPSTPLAVRSVSIVQVVVDGVKWEIVEPKRMMDIVAVAMKKGVPVLHSSWEKPVNLAFTSESSSDKIDDLSPASSYNAPNKQELPKSGFSSSELEQPNEWQHINRISMQNCKYALKRIDVDRELIQKMSTKPSEIVELGEVNFVYILDSGGQPPFREMLPHLIQQSSGIVLFQKLNERLDFKPTIKYREEGVEEKGYESELTNEQILQKYVQAVQSHKSTVFVIGTHRDLKDECEAESKADKDRRLLEAFQPVLGDNISLYDPGTPEQLIYPVDNTKRTEEEEKLAQAFRKAVIDKCMGEKVKIPLPWFMLEQLLQRLAEKMNVEVLSIEECTLAAEEKLLMPRDRCNAAIKYLSKLNILFYRPDILPQVVFSNVQVVLNKMTELVRCNHRMRNDTNAQNVPQGIKTTKGIDFKTRAEIDAELLKEFPSHYRPGLFEIADFLTLLEDLLIAGQLENGKHFIPSLLPDLSSEEVSKYRVISSDVPAPITFHYPEKWLPVGVVPALIVYLQNQHGWSPISRGGKPLCMYHNCIQFKLPGGKRGNVTMIDSTKFLEIHVSTSLKVGRQVCPRIRRMIECGLEEAHKSLHYKPPAAVVGLLCSSPDCGNKETHLALLDEDRESWTCSEDPNKGDDDLNENQKLWFAASERGHSSGILYWPFHISLSLSYISL